MAAGYASCPLPGTPALRRPATCHRRGRQPDHRVRDERPPRPVRRPELRHRRRACCEDRIRGAEDSGLADLPLHDFALKQIWCVAVALVLCLTAWTQMLALPSGQARRWEPKRRRHRPVPSRRPDRPPRPSRSPRSGAPLPAHHSWTPLAVEAITRAALPARPVKDRGQLWAPGSPIGIVADFAQRVLERQ
ncbi:transposase [Frankia sp. CH37]|nr:transposase [Parafrankia sp. CH37]